MSLPYNPVSQLRYASDGWSDEYTVCRLTGFRCTPGEDEPIDCTRCVVPIVEMLAGNENVRRVVE